MQQYLSPIILTVSLISTSTAALALAQDTIASITNKGIIDFRYSSTSSSDSYIGGGFGKFRYSDGQQLSIAHAGLETNINYGDYWSARVVTNGYLDGEDDAIGLTEAFVKYQGLPNENGYRLSSRLGVFYPQISQEHIATAWASKNTLAASTVNTWVGEEIRLAGIEAKLTRLGKFHQSNYDLSASLSLFQNNDPAGAILVWRGWSQGARQTLYHEKRPLPPLRSPMLVDQAKASDPFKEIDDNWGFHLYGALKKHRRGSLSFGYYDNQAKPFLIEQGNYGWRTRFYHLGGRWHFANKLELTWQYMHGDTLMQSPQRFDVVNAGYASGYIMLSKQWQKHRLSARIEEFSVDDKDNTPLDNNNEYGKGFTFSYQYRLAKPWFLTVEYNWLDSWHPSRHYQDLSINSTEQQLQLSARYFFKL